MAHFLKGKFKGFYKSGPLDCVKDVIRFRQLKESTLQMELTRRDMETYAGRFVKYEHAYFTLIPVDEAQPRLGGKVKVTAFQMDWRTFTPSLKTYYGVYSEDFLTYGEFNKDAGNPLENEEVLLKICDENDTNTVVDKTTFRFQDNKLTFRRDINEEVKDVEIEHPISEVELTPVLDQTWSETLFYGLGNKRM